MDIIFKDKSEYEREMKHEAISCQNHSIPYIYIQMGEFGQQSLNGVDSIYQQKVGMLSYKEDTI